VRARRLLLAARTAPQQGPTGRTTVGGPVRVGMAARRAPRRSGRTGIAAGEPGAAPRGGPGIEDAGIRPACPRPARPDPLRPSRPPGRFPRSTLKPPRSAARLDPVARRGAAGRRTAAPARRSPRAAAARVSLVTQASPGQVPDRRQPGRRRQPGGRRAPPDSVAEHAEEHAAAPGEGRKQRAVQRRHGQLAGSDSSNGADSAGASTSQPSPLPTDPAQAQTTSPAAVSSSSMRGGDSREPARVARASRAPTRGQAAPASRFESPQATAPASARRDRPDPMPCPAGRETAEHGGRHRLCFLTQPGQTAAAHMRKHSAIAPLVPVCLGERTRPQATPPFGRQPARVIPTTAIPRPYPLRRSAAVNGRASPRPPCHPGHRGGWGYRPLGERLGDADRPRTPSASRSRPAS